MNQFLLARKPSNACPITPLTATELASWLRGQSAAVKRWVKSTGFKAEPYTTCLMPDTAGGVQRVLTGVQAPDDPFALAHLPSVLPAGNYFLDTALEKNGWSRERIEQSAIGFGLGCYRFDRYKKTERPGARLALPSGCDTRAVVARVQGLCLTRDLINTPAQDMMPQDLAAAARSLARQHKGRFSQVVGKDLLDRNFPAIHAVGRASASAPRFIDLRFAKRGRPKLTLVGKGVCFDSGGLDLKSAAGMRLMKKDMGGAAHVLGLAHLVLAAGLPVQLRVLIAAVENAVSGNALRPGDVIATRKGVSVEIDNTDAEGRLVLSDALTEAHGESPDLIIDFATLTGAARVALGTELPAMFTPSDEIAAGIAQAGARVRDPVWRLPLHEPYREMLESKVADMVNSAASSMGGAIVAALFLRTFVPDTHAWVHFDLMAYNARARPGRPEGGEAMALRALLAYLQERYA
ncbi:MAG: leucyl aminopeptidase family protein [Gammaproteobacteria bacterium]